MTNYSNNNGGIPQGDGSIDNFQDASGVIPNGTVSQEQGPDDGGIINMPSFSVSPVGLRDDDIWVSATGVVELKTKINGTTYGVELT